MKLNYILLKIFCKSFLNEIMWREVGEIIEEPWRLLY